MNLRCPLRLILVLLAAVHSLCGTRTASAASPDDSTAAGDAAAVRQAEDHFESHIRPLLIEHCAECHGADAQEAGLRLDTRAAVEVGGESGPLLVPGDPDQSRLVHVIQYSGSVQMPPDGKLADEQIQLLVEWVRQGAVWPAEAPGAPQPASGDAAESQSAAAQAQTHWAFQPVVEPPLPPVTDRAWPKSPVDYFILSKLESNGLRPSESATRAQLIRRLSLDLTGLPPTAAEIEAFERDTAPDAWEQLVERLLGSPRYGERWGRHWLDVARYADTRGYVGVGEGALERREYPFAFSYRDWVIRAVNEDLPYDQFLMQQIAADKMSLEDPTALAALGFFRVGRVFLGNRNDQIDDKIDVLSRGLLGLTVACARCHDHKFDPIPTADYYSLFGVFASTSEPDDAENQRMVLADAENPHNARIFKRGNPGTPGDEVPRQFLSILSGPDRQPFTQGSGRLELAQAIVDPTNPLTARVMVNRVWDHHFGAPLVSSTSDFGVRTPAPEYAELLDHLASQFVKRGWSLKELHRMIVCSSAYQQASRSRPECVAVDSENSLLWRANRRRVDLEQMRDAMLAASGDLEMTVGGPSAELTEPPYSQRRTVYGRVDRQNLPGMFRTFDFANPDTHSPGRYETTVPQQGLFVFNHPFVIERARHVAERAARRAAESGRPRLDEIYRLVLARDPREDERQMAGRFIESAIPSSDEGGKTFDAWAQLAQALIMTNEFMFID